MAKQRARAEHQAKGQEMIEQRAPARQARLAAMVPDERARYLQRERWLKIVSACVPFLAVGGCIALGASGGSSDGGDGGGTQSDVTVGSQFGHADSARAVLSSGCEQVGG